MKPPSRARSFARALFSSAAGTALSRLLGAARDVTVAGFLGAGAASDAFWIAFTIPNTFRRFVADEGLTGAVVPTVARAERERGSDAARRVVDTAFTSLLLANLVLCGLGILGAREVVLAFAYAFSRDPEQLALAVQLTRWLFPFLAMVSVVSFAEGLLNLRGHFFVPKLAPGLVSLGMVAAALLARGVEPTHALAAGVLLGGLAHVLVNLPPLLAHWGPLRLGFAFRDPRLHHLLREMGKVAAIGVLGQLNILVLRQLAAWVGQGAITWYWNANRIVDLSQGVIAVAIGSALLPQASRSVAAGDWEALRGDIHRAAGWLAALLLPAAAVLGVAGGPVAAMLFRHGAYTWSDVERTAATLLTMLPFLLAAASTNVVKRVYFALDLRTMVFGVGAAGVLLTAAVGWLAGRTWGVPGLGAALSISTCTQLALYVGLLGRRVPGGLGLGALGGRLARAALAAVAPAAVLGLAVRHGEWSAGPALLRNWVVLGAGGAAALLAWVAAARALGVEEVRAALRRLGARA